MINYKDKAEGLLVGLAVGDALGVPAEGMSPAAIAEKYGWIEGFLNDKPAGSDDTEFAIFNILMLLEHGTDISSENIAGGWKRHIASQTGPFKGAGFSELMAVENIRKGLLPPQSGYHPHAWSDGLAMRASVFGAAVPGNPAKAAELAMRDGSVTHSGEGIYSGMAVAAAAAAAMDINPADSPSESSLPIIFSAALDNIPSNTWTHRAVTKGIKLGSEASSLKDALQKLYDNIACSYYHWADLAPEAVGISFGIIAASKGSFREAVLGGVNAGRDTDTIAAICGGILGAKIGYSNIPDEWKSRVTVSNGSCIKLVKDINLRQIAGRLADAVNRT